MAEGRSVVRYTHMASVQIKEQVPLAPYTTFQIGGPAEFFVSVQNSEALREAVRWAKERTLPITILGGGSNVLVDDDGVRGLVIHNAIEGIDAVVEGTAVTVSAGAGMIFDELVAYCALRGWWGLENLSCIPGTVGATPIQNIGAYGVEIASCIQNVSVYDMDTDVHTTLHPSQCAFAYRDSLFKRPEGKRYIVTGVTYALSTEPKPQLHYRDLEEWQDARVSDTPPTLAEIRNAVCTIRSSKFPDWTKVGTAGSFFKNPVIAPAHFALLQQRFPELPGFPGADGVKVSLAWILDRVLNVRGHREGTVGTYEGQALVIVNHGDATAADVAAFAQTLARRVFDATEIVVEWEVTKV